MSTFAESLASQIRSREHFWKDIGSVSSAAISRLLPGVNGRLSLNAESSTIERLIHSAIAFSQSESDADKGLAQDIALFSALVWEDQHIRNLAKEIFCTLGNLPGADRLSAELTIVPESLNASLRYSLLKVINTLPVNKRDTALTDFQMSVWSALPKTDVAAISAPASPGKSFVVVEYLCQQAI